MSGLQINEVLRRHHRRMTSLSCKVHNRQPDKDKRRLSITQKKPRVKKWSLRGHGHSLLSGPEGEKRERKKLPTT